MVNMKKNINMVKQMSDSIEMPKPETEKATEQLKISTIAKDKIYNARIRGETYSDTITRVFEMREKMIAQIKKDIEHVESLAQKYPEEPNYYKGKLDALSYVLKSVSMLNEGNI